MLTINSLVIVPPHRNWNVAEKTQDKERGGRLRCLFCGEEVVRWLPDGAIRRQNGGSNYWLRIDGEEKKSGNFWEIFIY
uniref:Uncharacterized protein n=1 Tax=Solanum tuberosum TaxID=4113 RepID=M1CJC5_SOLTU